MQQPMQYMQPSIDQLAVIEQHKRENDRYSAMAEQLMKHQGPVDSWGDMLAQIVNAYSATKMQKKADESASEYTSRMLEAQRQQKDYDREQTRLADEAKWNREEKRYQSRQKDQRSWQMQQAQMNREASNADWAARNGTQHQQALELKQLGQQQQQPQPSLQEKEQIKHNEKRKAELHANTAARRENLLKAERFKSLIENEEMSTGGWQSMIDMLPGTFSDDAKYREEFNAFAEVAARQQLKASGETRPTDADVEGMKRAMFGIGRDEKVNLNLLSDYIRQLKTNEEEYTGKKPMIDVPQQGSPLNIGRYQIEVIN